jgi:chromosome partitioning protein
MSGTIVAIATHKGGVGKTVITMAMSAAFARAGQPALVVDMDPQGHASIGLGVEVLDNELTLRDFFLDAATPIDKLIRKTHVKGLHVLPSNIRLAPVVQSLYMRPRREEMLRRGLASVRQHYSYIFIDCPPALGVLTETSLSAADLVIVPCQMEARAVDGLVDLLEMVSLIRGPSFDAWRILLNRVDTRKSVTNDAVMAELEPWADRILKTRIPVSEPLNQAQIERTDIFAFDPKSTGARAFEALARELSEDTSYPRGGDRRHGPDGD